MRPQPKLGARLTIAIFAGTLFSVTFLGGCKNRVDVDDEAHHAQAKNTASAVSVENGETVLTLDSLTQNRLGLQIAALVRTVTREETTAPALVLSTQDLATSRNGYVAAQTQLQKLRIEEDIASKEHARLKALFEENQNISQKSLQAAEGALQSNEADVKTGEQQLSLQESVVGQEWGSVVAEWVAKGTPDLQRILDQREILVQLTISNPAQPPKTVSLESPVGGRMEASFISTFPRIDPRIQGQSFLYLASGQPGLSPGANLVARLPIGNSMRGVIVPTSAVVWSEGRAWVYQQTATDRFTRRAVATNVAVEKGFFVAEGLSPGDKIVVQGAQTLLSEELLIHSQGAGESDEN